MKVLTRFAFIAMALAIFLFDSCKKDSITQQTGMTTKITTKNTVADSMVVTPIGLMSPSHVYAVESGAHLELRGGHVLKIQTSTGHLIKDLGVRAIPNLKTPNIPKNALQKNLSSLTTAPVGTYSTFTTAAELTEPTGSPITYFSTTWTVPTNPVLNTNQLIFIFIGTEPSADSSSPIIMQPVLQWGVYSAAGGGEYWGIANWFIWEDSNNFLNIAFSPLIQVAPGTSITGVIANTGVQSNGSYNFTSTFLTNGVAYNNALNIVNNDIYLGYVRGTETDVTIPSVSQQYFAVEGLQSYYFGYNPNGSGNLQVFPDVGQSAGYPADLDVRMTNIQLLPNSASLAWSIPNIVPYPFGEHTNIISNDLSGNGEVDLYFHPQPPAIAYITPDVFTVGQAIAPLNPVSTGGPVTSYSVSPALPAGLSLNTSTGVISGTPTTATSTSANYTITAVNTSGSTTCTINIIVNPAPAPISFDFQVTTNNVNPTYFTMVVNGVNVSGTDVETAAEGVAENINHTIVPNSNSTIVITVNGGYMPTSVTYAGYQGSNPAVISGNTITITDVKITSKQPSLNVIFR